MTTKELVLEALEQHRGQALSGQALADQFGISRTAVWKSVQALLAQGHAIESTPNQGYTLRIDSDILTTQGIRHYLNADFPLEVHQEIGSTNSRAKELAIAGAPHGTLVVANSQTAGRGRRGRTFISPAGTGLYLSMIVRSSLPMEKIVLITNAAAVAICRAVEKTTGKSLSIKWVNDLYTSQGKCCGILTEAATDLESGGLDYLVVGIGLNLFPPHNGWPQELQNIAASIFQPDERVDRCQLVAEIANELLALCGELPNIDFMSEYRARNIVPGHQIMILQNGVSRPALAQAITDEGHLLVTLPDGSTEQLLFGEVSIRL